MKLKGSERKQDKKLLLIVRECGTYLYTIDELYNYDFGRTICTYYGDSAKYFTIDLDKLSCKKISFVEVENIIRTIENDIRRKELSA